MIHTYLMALRGHLFCLACMLLLACQSGQGQKAQTTETTSPTPPEDQPLLVATGYGSALRNITRDSLLTLVQAGKVYVHHACRQAAREILQSEALQPINTLSEFATLAKYHLLIIDLAHLTAQYKVLSVEGVSFFELPEQYPLYHKQGGKPFDFKNRITKLMLTGVTAITRNTGFTADAHGAAYITRGVRQYFQEADFVHISNEVSIDPNCFYKKYDPAYRFCTKEAHMEALLDIRANIVELTGNHNKDYGAESYRLTMDWYKQHKMATFGGGLNPEQAAAPLIITLKDGRKMAFVGYNEACPNGECAAAPYTSGANRYQREAALSLMRRLKQEQKIDLVWVGVQFSEVDSYSPTATQIQIARDLVDAGADVVYGSQAHQVQKIEFYKGKPIFHGLGNFLFDQIHRIGVRQAYFLRNYLYEGRLVCAEPIFTFISDERIPMIATPAQERLMRQIVFEDRLLYK